MNKSLPTALLTATLLITTDVTAQTTPTHPVTDAPLTKLDLALFSGSSISCQLQEYRPSFCAPSAEQNGGIEPAPEWLSSDCGGYFIPRYTINFNEDGSYFSTQQIPTTFGETLFSNGAGTYTTNTGNIELTCGDSACTNSDVPLFLPSLAGGFSGYGEYIGNSLAIYNANTFNTERLLCDTHPTTIQSLIESRAGECTVEPVDGCNYDDAAANGGWGYNATTGESCPPNPDDTQSNECDYSNADLNGGWGWNAATRSSCPPE